MYVTYPTTRPVTHLKTLRVTALNDLTFDLPKPIHRRYIYICVCVCVCVCKVKWYRCRPSVAQRVGRGIALLFHDRGTRRGRVVSSTPRPHFTPGKDPAPILQEAGWAPGPVWTGGKSRPHRDSIPDRPARSQSLYRLSYPAHIYMLLHDVAREEVNNLQLLKLIDTCFMFQYFLTSFKEIFHLFYCQ